MTLVQLKYAVTLERIKNFAQAASELLIAQPTLSLQIQKLEKEIGIQIFDRMTNPISITPEGKEFLKQAKVVLIEANKLEYMYSQKLESPSGELQLGIIPTISSSLLIKLLPIINKNYPDIELKIFELPTYQILERLESGELDMGIAATPLFSKKIKEYPLYYEPFLLYVSEKEKDSLKKITVEDLQDHKMILLSEEHCFRGQILKICKKNSISRIEVGSFETIKKLVEGNYGITLLPYFEEVRYNSRLLPFSDAKPPAREVSIITSLSFYKTNILKSIKKEILSIIPDKFHSAKKFNVIGIEQNF